MGPGHEMSMPVLAKRCGVSLGTAHSWIRGIRVGSVRVKLACNVVGTRCRVTEEQLKDFQERCKIAKLGRDEPAPANRNHKGKLLAQMAEAERALGY